MNISITECPHCGNDHLYQLGDGRYKCSSCLRKSSPKCRRSRLAKGAINEIVLGFISNSPASEIASETGLNLKTVQLYLRRIRELLTKDREDYLVNSYGSAEVSAELFASSNLSHEWRSSILMGCLVDQETEIELLFAIEDETGNYAQLDSKDVSGWLVAADRKALDNLQIDRILCLTDNSSKQRVRTFWLNAKRRLCAYYGGFRKHFRLYLREMEFRNNIDSPAEAQDYVKKLLEQNSITSTGDEDA